MIKLDTQSHRATRFLLIIISPGPPPEAPLLLIAPQMRLLGFLSTYFGAVWLIVPGECHGNGLLKSQGT